MDAYPLLRRLVGEKLISERSPGISARKQLPEAMLNNPDRLGHLYPSGRATAKQRSLAAGIGASAHVLPVPGKNGGEGSERGHACAALQHPQHPFAITHIPKLRIKPETVAMHQFPPEKNPARKGR